MRKRKVKAWNHISCALVSFSCVYVRFAVPKTHPSRAYKFSALVLARAQCLRWGEKRNGTYKPIYKHFHNGLAQKVNPDPFVHLTSLHRIVLRALDFEGLRECMFMCCASKYDMRKFFGTKTTTKKSMECEPLFSFRRFVHLKLKLFQFIFIIFG